MTNKKKIRNIIELFIAWNGETEAIDIANLDSAIDFITNSLQEESVSTDLEKAARSYSDNIDNICGSIGEQVRNAFKAGAKWQKEHLWKPSDGDDLPEIDREVIALTQTYPNDEHLRVVFAHRPNKYAKVWNSNLGEEQVVEIEGYDKGGWNIPNVKWWLDVELPKEK